MAGQGYNEYGEIVDETADYGGGPPVGVMHPPTRAVQAKDRRRYSGRERIIVGLVAVLMALVFLALGAYFWLDGYRQIDVVTANTNATATVLAMPTVTPVPPTSVPTQDALAVQYGKARDALNQNISIDSMSAVIESLTPVVQTSPDYKGNAAIYLFWAYVRRGELESQTDLKLADAPNTLNTALKVGNDNKKVLQQQFTANASLADPPSPWLRKVSNFDDWLNRVQDEANLSSSYAAGADANRSGDANKLDTAIKFFEQVYTANPEYLHNAVNGSDKWVAFVLYDAYARKADNNGDKTTKCDALRSAKAVIDKNSGLSDDKLHIQSKLTENGC